MKWEYKIEQINACGVTDEMISRNLNDYGNQSWELVSIAYQKNMDYFICFFKREKKGVHHGTYAPDDDSYHRIP